MILAREVKSLIWYGCIVFMAFFLWVIPINAQNSAAIATYLSIENPNVLDGYIVATIEDKFVITNEAYQKHMVGIVNKNAAIEIRFGTNPDNYPVSTSGQGYVLVTLANGNITKGDYITSSPIEGVGMKATAITGPIIGVALEDASYPDETTITKIKINIQKNYNVEPLFGISSFKNNQLFPQSADGYKYLIGGAVLLVSLLFSFLYFGKLSLKGVEALGRNPLASRRIQIGIIFNVILALSICLIGFITAMYIITSS